MRKHTLAVSALVGSLLLAPLTGCESLPGGKKEQGAVIGGVGGALAGAALSKNERGLGALIGGALGAGGGYLIGAQQEKLKGNDRDEAVQASRRAEQKPARPEDVERTRTADLNDDGFVTLDEVVAMERASLSDREMLARLERTGQVFELTEEQERYLEDRGVSRDVIVEMRDLNDAGDLARTASDDGEAPRDRFEDTRRDREQSSRRDFERLRTDDVEGYN